MMIPHLIRIPVLLVAVLFGGVMLSLATAPHLPSTGAVSYNAQNEFLYLRIRDIDRHIDLPLVSTSVGSEGSWHPDGEHVSYIGGTDTGQYIEVLHVASGRVQRLLSEIDDMRWTTHAWSPDGQCLAFAMDGAVFTLCLPDENIERITVAGFSAFVTWSPDGRSLLYTATIDGMTDLYTIELATGTMNRLTTTGISKSAPRYMPDGEAVVYTTFFRDRSHIMHHNLITGEVKQLTSTGHSYSSTVSPDGRYIVYPEQLSPMQWELFLLHIETGETRQITHSAISIDEFEPEWVPSP
ncbi:MAG: hypothetical protein AAGK74_08235 [Chloroflexota bacterium]